MTCRGKEPNHPLVMGENWGEHRMTRAVLRGIVAVETLLATSCL